MALELHGTSIIGNTPALPGNESFRGINPVTENALEPPYWAATDAQIEQAVQLATEAFDAFSHTSCRERAHLLTSIADNIDAIVEEIVDRACQETALPEGRIRMECGRTTNQLRLFAQLLEEGSWVDVRIETAKPDRQPAPKPDIRSMRTPLGPVAVFGASNFPLAFSVAGGDTAAALAAGCPVIHKAHPSHPSTCELVGQQIAAAVRACDMPEGTFALLFDSGHHVGQKLVQNAGIKAVAFTGSRRGGRALLDLASQRPVPIPVYAEMGSVNPIFMLPGALQRDSSKLAEGLAASVTLGGGQFCTNPGIVFYDGNEDFRKAVTRAIHEATPPYMLNAGIASAYAEGVNRLAAHPSVETLAGNSSQNGSTRQAPALFQTTVAALQKDPDLLEELFGPSTILVSYNGINELERIAESIEGQLTATIHASAKDRNESQRLASILQRKAGRIIFGGFPTGVDVNHAMIHGGPYPATSDGRSTSVGTLAINRFTRFVSFQDAPDELLPAALQDENPLTIWRLLNGVPSQNSVHRP